MEITNAIAVETYIENTYEITPNGEVEVDLVSIEAIPWQNWFETWLKSLYRHLPPADSYELSLRLTSDREIQDLNAQFRQKNQPTDVLAFAALETNMIMPENIREPLYLGDLVISLETASRQASDRNHSLVTETAWLATHGLLHLLGWDHPDDISLEKMLDKQAALLNLVDITD